jgi:uncharacterized membrane protein YuzA (DUF378 family)
MATVYTNILRTLDSGVDPPLVSVHKLYNLSTRRSTMKKLDILAAVLVAVGGINWGLVAVAKFDLVATVVGLDFGQTNAASRIVYGLVGASALYQVVQQHAIRRRWSREPRVATA